VLKCLGLGRHARVCLITTCERSLGQRSAPKPGGNVESSSRKRMKTGRTFWQYSCGRPADARVKGQASDEKQRAVREVARRPSAAASNTPPALPSPAHSAQPALPDGGAARLHAKADRPRKGHTEDPAHASSEELPGGPAGRAPRFSHWSGAPRAVPGGPAEPAR